MILVPLNFKISILILMTKKLFNFGSIVYILLVFNENYLGGFVFDKMAINLHPLPIFLFYFLFSFVFFIFFLFLYLQMSEGPFLYFFNFFINFTAVEPFLYLTNIHQAFT